MLCSQRLDTPCACPSKPRERARTPRGDALPPPPHPQRWGYPHTSSIFAASPHSSAQGARDESPARCSSPAAPRLAREALDKMTGILEMPGASIRPLRKLLSKA